MARSRYRKNPLLELPRAGPLDCARIFDRRSASSWKGILAGLPPIRTVGLRGGKYYILQDVLRARHPQASDGEIAELVDQYVAERAARRGRQGRIDWIGPKEAAMIAGFRDARTFKSRLRQYPKIRKKKLRRGTYYALWDVFHAVFPEAADADNGRLKELVIEYKLQRSAGVQGGRK